MNTSAMQNIRMFSQIATQDGREGLGARTRR
jgi:hypothetical protein